MSQHAIHADMDAFDLLSLQATQAGAQALARLMTLAEERLTRRGQRSMILR